MSGDVSDCHNLGGGEVGEWGVGGRSYWNVVDRPGMLLDILQCTEQLPTVKNYMA